MEDTVDVVQLTHRWWSDIGEQWWIQHLSLWLSEYLALNLWLFCLCIVSPCAFPLLQENPVGKPSDKMTHQDKTHLQSWHRGCLSFREGNLIYFIYVISKRYRAWQVVEICSKIFRLLFTLPAQEASKLSVNWKIFLTYAFVTGYFRMKKNENDFSKE